MRSVASRLPLALGILGAAIPFLGGAFSGSSIALGWLTALMAVFLAPVLLRLNRPTRVFIDIVALVATLTVVAGLGGLWFVPAVVAQLVLDATHARQDAAAERVTLRGR